MLSTQPDLVTTEHEDVEVIASVVVRIALDATTVRSCDHRSQDVDHSEALSWSA